MFSFRKAFYKMVPGWLTLENSEGEKLLWVWAAMLDYLEDRARQGLEARFPSRTGSTSLALIGRDRGIRPGRAEAQAHYAERLKRWRNPRGHRVRGNAYALLEQVSEYFGGVHCWTIAANGGRRELLANGNTVRGQQAWTWDAVADKYRFWLVLDPAQAFAIDVRTTWVGLTHDDAIGQTGIGPNDARALRALTRPPVPWIMAGSTPQWIVIALIAGGEPTPDATWATWGVDVSGVRRPSRDPNFRYIAFRPYAYAGNPAAFPAAVQTLAAGDLGGNPANFAASVTLPASGATYAGNPATFASSVALPDDGDPPV